MPAGLLYPSVGPSSRRRCTAKAIKICMALAVPAKAFPMRGDRAAHAPVARAVHLRHLLQIFIVRRLLMTYFVAIHGMAECWRVVRPPGVREAGGLLSRERM